MTKPPTNKDPVAKAPMPMISRISLVSESINLSSFSNEYILLQVNSLASSSYYNPMTLYTRISFACEVLKFATQYRFSMRHHRF